MTGCKIMKIGPVNAILEPVKVGNADTKTWVARTVQESYMLPLQSVPDPLWTCSSSAF